MGFPALAPVPASQKRAALRAGLASGRLLRMPGAFSPLVARLVEELGFDGAYVSGAVVAADLGLPDVGLTTMTEVASRARQIASATSLPVLADADTGFGEPLNAARAVAELDDLGLAGCHLEDQVNPKRCGHLDGKEVVPTADMVRRIGAPVAARRDPGFLVVARSDARAVEGLEAMLDRARAYVDAGAEMLFPEALADEREFEAVRRAVEVPLLANMTEFGKTRLLDARTLADLGVNLVIYPVTGLRLAMGAVEDGLRRLRDDGTQAGLVDRMQTRARLYAVLLERLPDLELVLQTGGHAYHVDREAATARGVVVALSRRARMASASVPELTFGLMLAVLRRIHPLAAELAGGEWPPAMGGTLAGRTLGILGLGRHGRPVARIAAAFGMLALAWDRDPGREYPDDEPVAERLPLDDLLERSDVVSVHLKLSSASTGLLDAGRLARMRPGAILINTARGAIVDEQALLDALRGGQLAGAGLDVFATEPLPADHPLRTAPNVVLTPHIGWKVAEGFAEWAENAP